MPSATPRAFTCRGKRMEGSRGSGELTAAAMVGACATGSVLLSSGGVFMQLSSAGIRHEFGPVRSAGHTAGRCVLHIREDYLMRISFLTDFTPFTPRAISPALATDSGLATKPLSCTTPLKVSTLISVDFRVGSLKMLALTLVVSAVSSKYSPVPSLVGVDAQPATANREATKRPVAMDLVNFMIFFLLNGQLTIKQHAQTSF